ncbi:MAG: CPBP family intramembrane glutamic endopeptidase [Gammaproteobacteria bacterium]
METIHRREKATLVAACPVILLGLVNGTYKEALYSNPALYWVVDITQWIVLPLVCLALLYSRARVGPSDYGLSLPGRSYPVWEMVGAALLAMLLLGAAYWGLTTFLWRFPGFEAPTFTHHSIIPDGPGKIAVVTYLALTAGVVEEIFFRGLPWFGLRIITNQNSRRFIYIIGTSILFGLIHWENGTPEILATFVYGVIAAFLYLKLLNLWPLIGAHVLLDILEFW